MAHRTPGVPLGPPARHIRAHIAAARRRDRDADVTELRRALAVARVEDRVRAAVESAPPLPIDLADRLVDMIRSARSLGGEEARPA